VPEFTIAAQGQGAAADKPCMIGTFSIALSGINAARMRMDVAAHNIANLPTEGFRRQAVETASQPGGGVAASVVDAGPGDLIDDLLQLKVASYALRANLLSLQHAGRFLGALVDAKA
jgi:hypothetical protein